MTVFWILLFVGWFIIGLGIGLLIGGAIRLRDKHN